MKAPPAERPGRVVWRCRFRWQVDGFRDYTTATGAAFRNQGRCVGYLESQNRGREFI